MSDDQVAQFLAQCEAIRARDEQLLERLAQLRAAKAVADMLAKVCR